MCLQERLLKFIGASDLSFTDAHEEKRTPHQAHTFYSLVGCSPSCSRDDLGVCRSIHFILRDRSKTFLHRGDGRRRSYVPVQESFGQRIHFLFSSAPWLSFCEQEPCRSVPCPFGKPCTRPCPARFSPSLCRVAFGASERGRFPSAPRPTEHASVRTFGSLSHVWFHGQGPCMQSASHVQFGPS